MGGNAHLLTSLATLSCYVAILVCGASVIWIIYHHTDQPLKFIGKWSIASITLLAASCGMIIWHFQTNKVPDKYVPGILFGLFYRIGSAFVYVLFIKRLQHMFNDTKYRISNTIFIIFYCIIAIFLLLLVGIDICFYFFVRGYLTQPVYYELAAICLLCTEITDLLLSVGLIIVFVHKLRLLNIEIGLNHSYQYDDIDVRSSNSDNISLTNQQYKIITTMSKVTILSAVAIISTHCYFIYQGIMFWMNAPLIMDIIRYISLPLDCTINAICVVLNFDFAEDVYHRLCCCCHYCCSKLCAYKAKKEIMSEFKQRLL